MSNYFFNKNTCTLHIVLSRTVNILTTDDALNWAQKLQAHYVNKLQPLSKHQRRDEEQIRTEHTPHMKPQKTGAFGYSFKMCMRFGYNPYINILMFITFFAV